MVTANCRAAAMRQPYNYSGCTVETVRTPSLHRLVRHLFGIQHEGANALLLGGEVKFMDIV